MAQTRDWKRNRETMRFQIALSSRDELDVKVMGWLNKAFKQNA